MAARKEEPNWTRNLLFKVFSDPVISGHLQDAQVSALFIDAMHNPQHIHILNHNPKVKELVRDLKNKSLFEPHFYSTFFKKFMLGKHEKIKQYVRENFEVEEAETGLKVDRSTLSEDDRIEYNFLADLNRLLASLCSKPLQHAISLSPDIFIRQWTKMTETGTTLFVPLLCEFVYRMVYAQRVAGTQLEEASGSQAGTTAKQRKAKKGSKIVQQRDPRLEGPLQQLTKGFQVRCIDQKLNLVKLGDTRMDSLYKCMADQLGIGIDNWCGIADLVHGLHQGGHIDDGQKQALCYWLPHIHTIADAYLTNITIHSPVTDTPIKITCSSNVSETEHQCHIAYLGGCDFASVVNTITTNPINAQSEPNVNKQLSLSESWNQCHISEQVINKVATFEHDFEIFLESSLDEFIALEQTKIQNNVNNIDQPQIEFKRACTDTEKNFETYLTSSIKKSTYWKRKDECTASIEVTIRMFNTTINSSNMWHVIVQYISRWYPHFRTHTQPICIPQVYQCEDISSQTSTVAVGHRAETVTFKAITRILSGIPGRSLILRGMALNPSLRKYLCQVFATANFEKAEGSESKSEKYKVTDMHEFADILVLHERLGIWIFEDKATTTAARNTIPSAQGQLNRAETFLTEWLGINVPIRKIIALPYMHSSELPSKTKLKKEFLYFCKKDHIEDRANDWLEQNKLLADCNMSESDYNYLFASFTLAQIASFSNKLCGSVTNTESSENYSEQLKNRYLEAESQQKYEKLASSHGFLKENKTVTIKQHISPDDFYEITLLTPEQADIFHCESKLVLIEGPASSGKTVLIQLKALQQYNAGGNIVIVTPEYVWRIYKQFFAKHNIVCTLEPTPRIKLINFDAFLNDTSSVLVCCIFFDEDLNMGTTRFKNKLRGIINDALQIWLAYDLWQTGSGTHFGDSLKTEYKAHYIEFGLTTALRCTAEIYDTWKDESGEGDIELGHNITGPQPKCIQLEDSGSYLHNLSQLILTAINETKHQKSLDPHRICVVATIAVEKRDSFLKLFSIINNLVSDGRIKFVNAQDRFDEQEEMMKADCVTVDIAHTTKSHEFSAVIEIVDPVASPPTSYITKSRAISQYISLQINRKLKLGNYFEHGREEMEQLQYDTLISKVDVFQTVYSGASQLFNKSMQQITNIADTNSADFVVTSLQLLNSLHPLMSHLYSTFHSHVLHVHYWLATHKKHQFNADWSHPCMAFMWYCSILHSVLREMNELVHLCVLQVYEGNTILPLYVCWNMYSALTQYNYFKQVCTSIGEKGWDEGYKHLLKGMIGEYTQDEHEQNNIWMEYMMALKQLHKSTNK